VPAGFPPQGQATHSPSAVVTGPGPNTPAPPAEGGAATMIDPRVPPGPPPL
jgi:hypothetical protein